MRLSGWVLLLVFIPQLLTAQEIEYVSSGLWWSRAYDIAADSHYVYCAGDNFFILSNDTQGNLALAGGMSFNNSGVYAVKVKDNYAYLAADGGLQIIDCSDPIFLRTVGQCACGNDYYLSLEGDFAYLMARGEINISIVYIADPSHPISNRQYVHTGTHSTGLEAKDGYIFVADEVYGLYVIDVTEPLNPNFVVNIPTRYQATGIALQDSLIFITSMGLDSTFVGGALEIFNISNPRQPYPMGRYERDLATYADFAVKSDYAYLLDGSTVDIIDISNPENPHIADSTIINGGAYVIAASDGYLFTTDLEMIDGSINGYSISTPTRPVFISRYNVPPPFFDVKVLGTVAYVCSYVYVHSVNIEYPSYPRYVSTCYDSLAHSDIYKNGNFLYTSGQGSGLNIYSTQNPDSLILLSHFRMSSAFDLYAHGNYVYSTSSRGLSVVDVSNPAEPESVTVIPTPDVALKICGENNQLFVSTQNQNKLIEYDISNPASPEMVALYTVDVIVSMAIDNRHLYTLDQWSYFKSYDIATPGMLGGLDTVELPMNGANLIIDDDLAFFYCDGLKVYDISDPSNLNFVTSYNGPHAGGIRDIELPYLYSVKNSEMSILRFNPNGTIEPISIPEHFRLSQNYPNPFNSSTSISYSIPAGRQSAINIYDIGGRLVRAIPVQGSGSIVWNGRDDVDKPVSSGVYFYSIVGQPEQARKMLLLK